MLALELEIILHHQVQSTVEQHRRLVLVGTRLINGGLLDMQAAVRTLLAGVGEDPDRQGLRDTPKVHTCGMLTIRTADRGLPCIHAQCGCGPNLQRSVHGSRHRHSLCVTAPVSMVKQMG